VVEQVHGNILRWYLIMMPLKSIRGRGVEQGALGCLLLSPWWGCCTIGMIEGRHGGGDVIRCLSIGTIITREQ
jgi:hypothetical protein